MPRANETDGKEYRFISQEEFEKKKAAHAFAEWAEVHGHLYGTPWSELEQDAQKHIDILLDIDVQGAQQVMGTLKRAVSVFVMPPSLDVLWQRLSGRGTDAPEEQQRRFQKAQDEMKHYPEYQYTIRNVALEQAVWELKAVIMAERIRTVHVDPAHVFR